MGKNQENFQRSIQFLTYSYFGKWEQDPLYAAILRAYRDATMRSAFVPPVPKQEKFYEDKRDDIKEVLKIYGAEIIHQEIMYYIGKGFKTYSYIESYNWRKNNWINDSKTDQFKEQLEREVRKTSNDIKNRETEDYSAWHPNLCKELVELYSMYGKLMECEAPEYKKAFSYGNAQKWVNMTMKYLYIMSSLLAFDNEQLAWCEKISNEAKNFHVPLDNYIFKAMKKDLHLNFIKKESDNQYKICYLKKNGEYSLIKSKDQMGTVWSKIESYDLYIKIKKELEENIPDGLTPLEWENKVWLEVAQA